MNNRMMPSGPLFTRLGARLGPRGGTTILLLGLVSAGKALSLVMIASSLSDGVVAVIAGTPAWHTAVAWGIAAAIGRAAFSWIGTVVAARSAPVVKAQLRQELAQGLMHPGRVTPGTTGSLTALATVGIDELDAYYSTVLPAATNAAIIPVVVGARILGADWISAVVIALTVPLIPLFMALIGSHTRDRVAAASGALARLSDHLVELARGLPVLVGLGRMHEQTGALEKISHDYRTKTMSTLRTAFLSSLVLELIATVSVAVVAVFVGLRLLNGSLTLDVGLLVLILAPECFAPFRDLGAAFHSAQDGLGALRSVRGILDRPMQSPSTDLTGPTLVSGLTVRYSDRSLDSVTDLNFTVERGSIVALTGPSGAGKSTVLSFLAGRLQTGESVQVTGKRAGVDATRIAWVPQHPVCAFETVASELDAYGAGIPTELRLERIQRLAGLFSLTGLLDDDPARLSPGELRRVAVARALLRVDAGAELILLDEPTAHLDPVNARAVAAEIEALRGLVTVILASHDPLVIGLATTHIALAPPRIDLGMQLDASRLGSHRASASKDSASKESASKDSAFKDSAFKDSVASHSGPALRDDLTPQLPASPEESLTPLRPPSSPSTLRLMARFIRPARGRFLGATLLGVAAALFAIALTAVSGWLIVRASEHVAIMYLLVAIVGVRFFGVGRSVLHYGERLLTHDAIFSATGKLRMQVWNDTAHRGLASRLLLSPGATVDYLVVTVDRIRDLVPRVVTPVLVGVIASGVSALATAIMFPAALPPLLACLGVSLLLAPAIASLADRRSTPLTLALQSQIAHNFARLVSASGDLALNGVDSGLRQRLVQLDSEATRHSLRSAWSRGAGHAIVLLATASTSSLMLAFSASAVATGRVSAPIVAVLVLLPLALIEPLIATVDAVQLWPAAGESVRKLFDRTVPVEAGTLGGAEIGSTPSSVTGVEKIKLPGATVASSQITRIEFQDISARWPGAAQPVFTGLTAQAQVGEWLIVEGPSGSGKSTLLALLLGYLRPVAGRYRLDGQGACESTPSDLHSHFAWAPQEGHIFNSTIRANLLLGRPRGDRPSDTEMEEMLRRVGLGPVVDSLPMGLDTRVGSEGSQFSGGQRQRLVVARTLLSRSEIVLLDEPTAHLDHESAASLLSDLRSATRDRIVVMVTHHSQDISPNDRVLVLEQNPSGRTASHPQLK